MPHTPTVRVADRVYALKEFNDMDRIQLLHIRRDVEGALHEICAQLETEELVHQHTDDPDWLVRATRAKRAYTRAIRHIDATLDIKKIEHQSSLLQAFINAARDQLPMEIFTSILAAAQQKTQEP